jgi:XTP/dITP diphosphohydrolase
MNLWIATGNRGKLSEFKILLERDLAPIKIFSTADLPVYSAPPENGQTFLDNARIKAKSIHAMKPEEWVIADDSGLEVEALGNLPGVHSARYAGPHAGDSENIAKLLKMMQIRAVTNRNAKFICKIVALAPASQGSTEWIFTGEMLGTIAKKPAGNMGFGYDPIFIPEGQTQSLAEIGPSIKSKISHRAKATLDLIAKFKLSL